MHKLCICSVARVLSAIFLLIASATIEIPFAFSQQTSGSPAPSEPVRMMTEIWTVFNQNNCSSAIQLSDALVARFNYRAQYQEERLKDAPIATDRSTAYAQEPLNQVGTALWIKGRCLQDSGDLARALETYKEAAKYKHALSETGQGSGSFWQPAEDATARAWFLEKR